MFKRFHNQQLLILLLGIFILYLGATFFSGGSKRTFEKTLVAIDTTRLSRIVIHPKGSDQNVTLSRSGQNWQVTTPEGQSAPTAAGQVERALEALNYLEANQLVSRDESDWATYEVNEEGGTRVEVFEGEEKVADLILGKFEYQQTGMSSYVREYEEDEIYGVNGYLDASFNRQANDWRDKTLISGSSANWSALSFRYPADSSFQLLKGADNQWRFIDTTRAIDGSAVSTYLNSIARTQGSTFVSRPGGTTPQLELLIQSATAETIEIKAYADPEHQYVLSSSLNPGAYFSDPDGSLVEKLFVGESKFEPTGE